jgi:hypothetical protein
MDFFHPEALKDAGILLGGRCVGAAVGVVADQHSRPRSARARRSAAPLAVPSQVGAVGRKLANKLRDVHELTVKTKAVRALSWQLRRCDRWSSAATRPSTGSTPVPAQRARQTQPTARLPM